MLIRASASSDLARIIAIENREILENFAHFGETATTLEQAHSAFESGQGKYPWMVAEDEEEIVGFARCGPWKAREGYRFTTEVGVYVQPDRQGQGIGRMLYDKLFPAIRECGFRTVLAGIAQPNPASNRLHEAMGMKFAGELPNVGFKRGRWISVGYWALHLPALDDEVIR